MTIFARLRENLKISDLLVHVRVTKTQVIKPELHSLGTKSEYRLLRNFLCGGAEICPGRTLSRPVKSNASSLYGSFETRSLLRGADRCCTVVAHCCGLGQKLQMFWFLLFCLAQLLERWLRRKSRGFDFRTVWNLFVQVLDACVTFVVSGFSTTEKPLFVFIIMY